MRAIRFIIDFYDRNLFERLIIYGFFSAFLTAVIFELLLGQWSFLQSQNKQWFFYMLLALDYLVSLCKVINIRVTANPMSALAVLFFIMVAHGLFIGIVDRNAPFEVFNDMVPLLMIGMNILRMQSVYEFKPIDFRFLLHSCTILAIGCCAVGLAGQLIGNPTQPSMGSSPIYMPLFLAGLFTLRPFPKWILVAGLAMFALTLPDFNRTSLAFIFVVVSGFVGLRMLKNPVMGIFSLFGVVMLLSLAWALIPEGSKTYDRVMKLTDMNTQERTGAIGERFAEWDAIQNKLADKGPEYQLLGLGFGGRYEVRFTHEYLTNYGHAHYAWSWFNMRFGAIGYIYMALFMAALAYNGFMHMKSQRKEGIFVFLLCLLALIYCLTYVNGVFLLSGIHFFHDLRRRRNI